jgi:hypothetical protein
LDEEMKKATKLVSLEVVNFRQEMARIEEEVRQLANKDIEGLIKYATSQLKVVTPVDTGEARKGWFEEIERNHFGGFSGGTIINEVDHIGVLNQGSSKQAPRYFIEQTLTKIGVITPN